MCPTRKTLRHLCPTACSSTYTGHRQAHKILPNLLGCVPRPLLSLLAPTKAAQKNRLYAPFGDPRNVFYLEESDECIVSCE